MNASLMYSKTSIFAGDLTDSKSASGGMLCLYLVITHVYRKHGHAKTRRQCHSSTEAEVIAPDGGLRMEGFLALTLWDIGSTWWNLWFSLQGETLGVNSIP